MKSHDVIVVGCGTGGAIASKVCSMANLDVVAVDAKDYSHIGTKVCGDAVTGIYFEILKDIDLKEPNGTELTQTINGLKLFGHKKKHCLTIENEENNGYMLNRYEFGQRLLRDTVNSGTKVYDNSKVIDVLTKNNTVEGVIILNKKTGEQKEIYSKIVIDAGGYTAPVRSRVPFDTPGLEKKIDKRDIENCYREIRDYSLHDSYLQLYVDIEVAPGGYMWLFPKGEHVNLGVGIQGSSQVNPKKVYEKFISSFEFINESKLLSKGGGVVPVRHPIDSLVSNGLMLVGDAASQVNPMHGGGIGFSMRGGYYAAKVAIESIKNKSWDINALWKYNVIYMKDMGAKQASLEVLKLLLQTLSNNEIDFIFRKKIFTAEELMSAVKDGTFKISFFDKVKRLLISLRHISMLKKLTKIGKLMKSAMKIYQTYPEQVGSFENWKKEQSVIFEEVYDLCCD